MIKRSWAGLGAVAGFVLRSVAGKILQLAEITMSLVKRSARDLQRRLSGRAVTGLPKAMCFDAHASKRATAASEPARIHWGTGLLVCLLAGQAALRGWIGFETLVADAGAAVGADAVAARRDAALGSGDIAQLADIAGELSVRDVPEEVRDGLVAGIGRAAKEIRIALLAGARETLADLLPQPAPTFGHEARKAVDFGWAQGIHIVTTVL